MLLSEGESRCLCSVAGMTYEHSERMQTPRAWQEVRFSWFSFLPFGFIPTVVLIAFCTLCTCVHSLPPNITNAFQGTLLLQ